MRTLRVSRSRFYKKRYAVTDRVRLRSQLAHGDWNGARWRKNHPSRIAWDKD